MAVLREYLYGVNLHSTKICLEEAQRIQDADANKPHGERADSRLQAFTSAAVLHATGFLEALINEFLMDIVDRHDALEDPVDEKVAKRIDTLWTEALKRSSAILPKYQLSLSAFDATPFDPGRQPYQEAAALVKLRNSLVHHKPSSTDVILGDVNEESPQALVETLKPFVKANPWHDGATTSALNRILWAGTAEWALCTAINFTDEFYTRIQRPRPYDFIVTDWNRLGSTSRSA